MGLVHAEITLKNAWDITNARHGIITEPEIRQTTVTAMVDTGAATLIINENIRRQLGLSVESTYEAELADGSVQTYGKTEAVQIQWKNRDTVCRAVVVPNANDVLLGAIPLEDMDLIVNPAKQELTGAHGDTALYKLK
jgi:clan AA aspartic protease